MCKKKNEPIEQKLEGGRVTEGVVRIKNVVHRPMGPHSDFSHALLLHLQKVGFNDAPRFLGIDEMGREMLSFIPGEVPANLGEWTDDQLITAAKLIRKFHDATAGSLLVGECEVVCHNDLSPCNFVMQQEKPFALIDFDTTAPGTRIRDLAYALWMWCCLGEEIDFDLQIKRIRLMCDAYGIIDRKHIVTSILKRQRENIENCRLNVEKGLMQWQGAVEWGEMCYHWVLQHKESLESGLK
jgi:hypothetical protein